MRIRQKSNSYDSIVTLTDYSIESIEGSAQPSGGCVPEAFERSYWKVNV